jgi:hypothetical protein
MTSRAAADGLDADQAAAELVISHGAFLERGEFSRYITTEPSISDGMTVALIDWDATLTDPGRGGLAVSGSERRILRIAASLLLDLLRDWLATDHTDSLERFIGSPAYDECGTGIRQKRATWLTSWSISWAGAAW